MTSTSTSSTVKQCLCNLSSRVSTLENKSAAVDADIDDLETETTVLDGRVDILESRVLTLDSRVDALEISGGGGGGGGGSSSGANPTAKVGLSSISGSALTFMRSDAAPALDQAINPLWTGEHIFLEQVKFAGGAETDHEAYDPNHWDGDFTVPTKKAIRDKLVTMSGSAPANPASKVGLNVISGIAQTFMRSDAAPALNQAISPAWSGDHYFGETSSLLLDINPEFRRGFLSLSYCQFAGLAAANWPLVLIQNDFVSPNTWHPNGTALGVNAEPSFAGNLIDLQLNSVSRFKVGATGLTTVTGLLVERSLAGSVETTAGTGPASLQTLTSHMLESFGSYTLTLANGLSGQIKIFTVYVISTVGASITLIPSSRSGYSSIVFTKMTDCVILQFTSGSWSIISCYGATVNA